MAIISLRYIAVAVVVNFLCMPAALATTITEAGAVCGGLKAHIAQAGNQDAQISFNTGEFTVSSANGSLEIYEGTSFVARVQGFTYQSYTDCLKAVLASLQNFEQKANKSRAIKLFDLGYDTNKFLTLGQCFRSLADAGAYFTLNSPDRSRRDEIIDVLGTVDDQLSKTLKRLGLNSDSVRIADTVNFYGANMPYFSSTDVDNIISSIRDQMNEQESTYFEAGAATAAAAAYHNYYYQFVYLYVSKVRQEGYSLKADAARKAEECASQRYNTWRSRAVNMLGDIGLSNVSFPDIPSANQLSEQDLNQGSDFERTYVPPIRQQLR